MSYYGNQGSKVKLSYGLESLGWSIYGFNEDQSDCMVDYFHPASWDGIAVKNGFILVVDAYSSGEIGGDFIQKSYDAKIANKIKKLQALADCPSAAKGERENALAQIEKLDQKLVKEITVTTDLPKVTYQKNPPNTKWHIEKDGNIIAKGNGIYAFDSVNTWREESLIFDKEEHNIMDNLQRYWNIDDWDTFINNRKEERQKAKKLLDKYFSLLHKWDKFAQIKLGEGDEEKLVKKVIEEKATYYVAELSDKPTEYIKVNSRWSISGISNNDVYKINESFNTKKVTRAYTHFDDGAMYTYKLEPRKNTGYTHIGLVESRIEKGVLVYVNLVKKVVTIKKEIWVKEKPKRNEKKKTSRKKQSNKEQQETTKEESQTQEHKYITLLKSGELKDFERTDNQEVIKVVCLKDKIDDFKDFNTYLKVNKIAYYSGFAKGFILKEKGLELFEIQDDEEKEISLKRCNCGLKE